MWDVSFCQLNIVIVCMELMYVMGNKMLIFVNAQV